jgi:dTDP-4-dehydrorhamnose 3,5-epimerase-like enzyme
MDKPEQIPLNYHIDDRGFLCQIYGNYVFPNVKRIYVVGNFAQKVIRGFHKHYEEWKGYFVINGAAKFVVVNENEEIYQFVLSDKNPSILIVPPKHAHGWISLSDHTVLIGITNKSLEDSLKDDFREDPFKYGKEIWEVKPR